jgi:KamA family protein
MTRTCVCVCVFACNPIRRQHNKTFFCGLCKTNTFSHYTLFFRAANSNPSVLGHFTSSSALGLLQEPQDVLNNDDGNPVAVATATDEQMATQAVTVDGLNNMIGINGMLQFDNQPNNERYKAISLQAIDKVAERHPELEPHLDDIRLSGLVFPFKASPYFVDELIDWSVGSDKVKDDPFYRLVFPTMDMLEEHHREKLVAAKKGGNPTDIMKAVAEIREDLNPHPAGQKTLNAPKNDHLTGVQHKYSETVLVFPAAAQTCHAYCTYCFRWAQFIGDDELRFAQKEANSLFEYLAEHEEVSDILMTGGDPMIMKTKSLAQYLEPLCDPNFLPHIKNLRIGTRSLSFWPQRFTTDSDADELIDLLRRAREEGGRHIAIMAHLGHARELSTQKVKDAVERIQKEAFATIRSQSPVMRGINDDAQVWADKWRKEVQMGIIPYYMFMARDTGAQHFFDVPLEKAQRIYSDALRNTSGLIRTVRGPSMSCTPGKVEVTGVEEILGHKAFVLRFLQCRDENWIGRPFFAKYDPKAVWFDDLEPLPGMELPWDENGLPRPVIPALN